MDRPFVTLMLRDSLGRLVELPQDTHPGLCDAATSTVSFAQSRELHTSLRAVPPGSVLYFELRHWKHAQKRFSTAAWTYVPMDALVDFGAVACRVREGSMRLPLYKKPVDVSLVRTKRMGGGTNELVLSLAGVGQEAEQGP
ncbi:hypothetical protein H632_c3948p0 [Helicosporidium sp. ATCC 50920]|nr:hypothetical protein H632_c3948p0 [Helicosporidium sp. ATCC 50920]|eukprot:KDD72050.1 hypothetical protein H632_c3948p0 [Helicosporidium sp. ATCC 50920]